MEGPGPSRAFTRYQSLLESWSLPGLNPPYRADCDCGPTRFIKYNMLQTMQMQEDLYNLSEQRFRVPGLQRVKIGCFLWFYCAMSTLRCSASRIPSCMKNLIPGPVPTYQRSVRMRGCHAIKMGPVFNVDIELQRGPSLTRFSRCEAAMED